MTAPVLFCLQSGLILLVLFMLPFRCKGSMLRLFAVGFIVSSVWFFAMHFTPQIFDVQSDSLKYIEYSKAISLHWSGKEVYMQEYPLQGLLIRNIEVWQPESSLPIVSVLGTQHIVYHLFLAVWQTVTADVFWLKAANIPFMAACFPLTLFLASALFAPKHRLVFFPCVLLAFNSAFYALGSVVLRDTIITFLVLLLFAFLTSYWRFVRKSYLIGIMFVIMIFMGLRYHFGLLFFLAAVGMFLLLYLMPNRKDSRSFFAIRRIKLKFFFIALFSLLGVLMGDIVLLGWDTILGSFGLALYDGGMANGVANGVANGRVNFFIGIVRTLFAPYPWVAIYPGLTWESYYELFLLGSFIFILFLPVLFIGLHTILQRRLLLQIFILFFIALVAAAYFVAFGEFSTRQRESVMPYLWVVVAFGIKQILDKREVSKGSRNA